MTGRILSTPACLAEGAEWLVRRDPRFAAVIPLHGPLPLRRREAGFQALLGAIVSQQVSVASARAIMARLEAAGMIHPEPLSTAADETLRALGLSRQKARYARELARAGIDFDALGTLPEEEIVTILTAIPGIGRWTAEIYAMFALGRADIFAANDLALQEAARLLFDLPARPTERQLRLMSEDWRPWRSVAAQMLWAYYHVAKSREGIT